MKTLANADDLAAIRTRIAQVTPDDPRQFGIMSPAEMLCHLRDTLTYTLSGRTLALVKIPIPRPLFKWLALRAPQWRPGIKTPPEVDQRIGGTPPVDFETDRAHLLTALDHFAHSGLQQPHPMFGPMSSADWMRWGYLHCNHHLRQFVR